MNEIDRAIWDGIFIDVPAWWRTAPPSRAMTDCTGFFTARGVRSVLDLGCGIGRWAMHLGRAGFDVSGSDFAPNAVAYARAWAEEEGLPLRFACCPVTGTPFPGETFDGVVAALVLDNIARQEMTVAIERMQAALRPGGVAFCLFNPPFDCADAEDDNPTAGITRVVYSDAELAAAFPGFDLLDRCSYEAGTRGLFLQRSGRP